MSIWFKSFNLDEINAVNANTMVEHCGIQITEVRDDGLVGVMPVTAAVKQPFGIVHGGANCTLAETLGSMAAFMTCDPDKSNAVGLSITTNHTKSVSSGIVTGVAKPVKLGRNIQVWDIKTYNDDNELTSVTVFTVSIIPRQR